MKQQNTNIQSQIQDNKYTILGIALASIGTVMIINKYKTGSFNKWFWEK